MSRPTNPRLAIVALIAVCLSSGAALSQSVCLPAPRLLTTKPMGGSQGAQFELTITGENIEDADELYFSDPRITATRKLDDHQQPIANHYIVNIAADCPAGIVEARVMTRLGISSSRVFSISNLPETQPQSPNTSLATAMKLKTNTVCNAAMTAKSVDHYTFDARKGQRYVIQCDAKGIDSKLDAVLILASQTGQDLVAERLGGQLDYVAPTDGPLVIKVHELTFKGGPEYFYRLCVHELSETAPLPKSATTRSVSAGSWPPAGLSPIAAMSETEKHDDSSQAIELPCDIGGAFFPAADVDRFDFVAKKGEVWWIELASERLGLPTDAHVLVQRVTGEGAETQLIDVTEFNDIASPVKLSSNGYAYDGPPYDAGSPDVLGKLEINEDGMYRIQVTDLFGGTRSDARNIYRLIVRKPAPDFALMAWPLHMELRNGDRAAFSKPLALRGGATMALEVVAIRRDGFNDAIDLVMEDLPAGVTATGLQIAAGKSRGIMLVSAAEDAPRAFSKARFYGRAQVEGVTLTRPCAMAELKWPVPDSWSEIPEPRLVEDVPVSVSGFEKSPFSLTAAEQKVWEVTAGDKLSLPLKHTRRSEFSGSTLQLRAFGHGFESMPMFDVTITDDQSTATLNLATLKTAPGDYLIAFYGGAVAKYRYCPEAIDIAEVAHRKAQQSADSIKTELESLRGQVANASPELQADLRAQLEQLEMKHKAATVKLNVAAEQVKAATERAKPKDIVDIVVSEPIAIRVKPQ